MQCGRSSPVKRYPVVISRGICAYGISPDSSRHGRFFGHKQVLIRPPLSENIDIHLSKSRAFSTAQRSRMDTSSQSPTRYPSGIPAVHRGYIISYPRKIVKSTFPKIFLHFGFFPKYFRRFFDFTVIFSVFKAKTEIFREKSIFGIFFEFVIFSNLI